MLIHRRPSLPQTQPRPHSQSPTPRLQFHPETDKSRANGVSVSVYEGPDAITVRLFIRWHSLRKLGKELKRELVPCLLQDGPFLYTFSNAFDPWGSKSRISLEELTRVVEIAESNSLPLRKNMGMAGQTEIKKVKEA